MYSSMNYIITFVDASHHPLTLIVVKLSHLRECSQVLNMVVDNIAQNIDNAMPNRKIRINIGKRNKVMNNRLRSHSTIFIFVFVTHNDLI